MACWRTLIDESSMLHAVSMRAVCVSLLLLGIRASAADPVLPPPPTALALDLDGCVGYALTHALDLAQQRLAVSNAGLGTLIARQKFAPELEARTTHKENDAATAGSATLRQALPAAFDLSATADVQDFAGDAATSNPGYALLLSKRILGGGSYGESMLDIDNSLIDEVIAANRLSLFERNLVRRVVRQYYEVHRARQTLAIRQRRLDLSRTNLDHAIAREDPLDIANAQLEVPASESALLRSKRDIDTALDAIKQLLGISLGAPLDVVGELGFATQDVEVEEDIRRSADTHEDVINQRLELRKLSNELPVLRDRVLPVVDVAGGATRAAAKEDSEWGLETRVTASWTLLARAERAKVRVLENKLADAQLALELLLRDRETTLRDLARRLEEARLQVELGRQRLDVSARRSALYADRWENGAIDILELIRSQNDLEDGRVNLVDLEITYLETLTDYRHAVGVPIRSTSERPAPPP